MSEQLSLFKGAQAPSGDELPDHAEDLKLAQGVPESVRFGTSSWTFPGWAGLVYKQALSERALVERGLCEYAAHPLFRTVGIDSSYYRPLAASTLRRYAEQLPPDYPCVMKVWNRVTSLSLKGTQGVNPDFLDSRLFEREVLAPLEPFRAHQGPLVFEFAPMPRTLRPSSREFCAKLDDFLGRLSKEFRYAVELRNRQLFTRRYLGVLHKHGVAHVLNFWEQMPSIGEQLQTTEVLTAEHVVARLLIPPHERYQERKQSLAPFDKLVDPQPEMRQDVIELMTRTLRLDKVLFVIVNNKAEGSSPLTIRALIQQWHARSPQWEDTEQPYV